MIVYIYSRLDYLVAQKQIKEIKKSGEFVKQLVIEKIDIHDWLEVYEKDNSIQFYLLETPHSLKFFKNLYKKWSNQSQIQWTSK